MDKTEEVNNEIIELENTVILLKDKIKEYRNSNEDSVERRTQLARMQISLGKFVRRIRTLKGLV